MNERILELADQAGVSITAANKNGVFTLLPDSQKKFAELIIGECLMLAQSYPSQMDDYAAGIDSVRESIKEHFGIQE